VEMRTEASGLKSRNKTIRRPVLGRKRQLVGIIWLATYPVGALQQISKLDRRDTGTTPWPPRRTTNTNLIETTDGIYDQESWPAQRSVLHPLSASARSRGQDEKTLFLDLNLRVNCAGTMVDGRENAASKIDCSTTHVTRGNDLEKIMKSLCILSVLLALGTWGCPEYPRPRPMNLAGDSVR
jgi:hypothetical protein